MTALIFDLDGVIADTGPAHFASWQRVAAELGVSFGPDDFTRMLGRTRRDSLRLLVGRHADEAGLLARKQAYFLESLNDFGPDHCLPGVRPLLIRARGEGLPIGLASSSRNARRVLERLALVEFFDAIVDGNAAVPPKPAPDIFVAVAMALGVAPSDCIVFEDSEAGLAAARSAGCQVIAVESGRGLADLELASLVQPRREPERAGATAA